MDKNTKSTLRRQVFKQTTGRDYSEYIQDMLNHHEAIETDFFSSVWGATQNLDSQIVERVLVSLLDADIPVTALPIHDSFLVPIGEQELLKASMNNAYYEVIQSQIKIDVDETVFSDLKPNEGEIIVANEEIHKATKSHMKSHQSYHLREQQWQNRFGPID